MISTPYSGPLYPKEVIEAYSLVSNYRWIFDFVFRHQKCKSVDGFCVEQFELHIDERANGKKFDPIIFQCAGKNYSDIEAAGRGVFYRLATMLSDDLDDYSLDEIIHLRGIRDFVEKSLKEIYSDVNTLGFCSKPIIYQEPKPQYYELNL